MSNTTLNLTTNSYNNSTTPDGPRGPPLWYQYPECAVAPYGYVFYFTGKMFNLAVGTPCNVLVIWQIATRRSDVSSDIFFLNLAILDTYFCLMGPVDMANRLVLSSGRLWYFQRFAYGVKDLAPLFLVCICLDRYMAVVHPVLFAQVRDNRIRIGVSVLVWGIILAYGISKSFLGSLGVYEIFSGIILFAFAVMVFCNISIIWVLRRSVLC